MSNHRSAIHHHELDLEIRRDEFLGDDIVSNRIDGVFCRVNEHVAFVYVVVEHVLFAGAVVHVFEEFGLDETREKGCEKEYNPPGE